MATSPLFGWEEPDDVDLVKDGAAAIRTLGNAIDTSMGDLLGGTSGQVLSKASNTNMDFTWVTPDDANAIQNAIVDAKGDLITATAADTPARLAVGTNGQVLTADSTAATGLAWATASSGGGLTLLSTTTLTTGTTTISSISGSYKNLLVLAKGIYCSGNTELRIRLNSDSGSNYSYRVIENNGGTISGAAAATTSIGAGSVSSNTDWSNLGSVQMTLYRYTDTSNVDYDLIGTTYTGSAKYGRHNWGRYNASAAITSITFLLDSGTFTAGTVYIYGEN